MPSRTVLLLWVWLFVAAPSQFDTLVLVMPSSTVLLLWVWLFVAAPSQFDTLVLVMPSRTVLLLCECRSVSFA